MRIEGCNGVLTSPYSLNCYINIIDNATFKHHSIQRTLNKQENTSSQFQINSRTKIETRGKTPKNGINNGAAEKRFQRLEWSTAGPTDLSLLVPRPPLAGRAGMSPLAGLVLAALLRVAPRHVRRQQVAPFLRAAPLVGPGLFVGHSGPCGVPGGAKGSY